MTYNVFIQINTKKGFFVVVDFFYFNFFLSCKKEETVIILLISVKRYPTSHGYPVQEENLLKYHSTRR